MKLLFVCTGNICRSPTADGVMRRKLIEADLHDITVDSAGTHGYHIGESPDPRTIATAKRRGYDLSHLRARRICAEDFHHFDLIYGMDSGHVQQLQSLMPRSTHAQVALFTHIDVPDPYYGNQQGFEDVLDLVEKGCDVILQKIIQRM